MPRISDIARQRLMHMILEDVGAGLVDHQIMDKRGINARTFYRYKKLIGKQCQKILDKQSEEDISLAIFQLEQRYTKYLLSLEKKLDDTANATTTNRKSELYEMAAELAKKIFNLKCKGSTLVMRWRKDRQDIEVITGYIPPPSDTRIQMPEYEGEPTKPKTERSPEPQDIPREKLMEFDKDMMDNYRAEVMRRNNFTTDEQYKKWVFEGNSLPDEEIDWTTGRPRGHWYTSYIERVCHMLNLTTSEFEQGIIDGKIPRGPLEQWRKQQQQQEQKESAATTAAKELARRMDRLFD